jgi:hypothetical protein
MYIIRIATAQQRNFRRYKPSEIKPIPSEIIHVRRLRVYFRRYGLVGSNRSEISVYPTAVVGHSLFSTVTNDCRLLNHATTMTVLRGAHNLMSDDIYGRRRTLHSYIQRLMWGSSKIIHLIGFLHRFVLDYRIH